MEKIDISKIRGKWIEMLQGHYAGGGDDTIQSIEMVAEKVNEIIEILNTRDIAINDLYKCDHSGECACGSARKVPEGAGAGASGKRFPM